MRLPLTKIIYGGFILVGILDVVIKSNDKGGGIMAKYKNNQMKNKKKAMPKTDVEFAENGLDKIALKAQKSNNK